jgi:CBS domain-containing protein
MQTIAEVMTREVTSISPKERISRAAQIMNEMDVGAIPVCDGQRLVGMITDRDITIRATSMELMSDDTLVEEVMTEDVQHCFDNQTIDEVLEDIEDSKIRRIPVLDHNTNAPVGIVALSDLATRNAEGISDTLKNISTSIRQRDRPRPH